MWSIWEILLFFQYREVAWNNLTTRETLFAFYSSSGRSPGTIWPLAKPFSRFILHRVGRLEQFDHSPNPFRVLFFLSGRSPGTIWPLAKPFSRFILHRAGRLEQFDHSRNPFHVLFFLSGKSPGTIRPLAKPFSRFILIGQVAWNNLTTRETLFALYSSYWAGCLEQLDHSRNPFRVLFFIGQVAWNN
jgi:hypothetical protein